MDSLKDHEEVRLRLGAASGDDFERLCCELLRREFAEYAPIESSLSALGKVSKGTPDAHVRFPDNRYAAFQFTTQQSHVRRKVMGDMAKLSSKRCHFHDRIAEVVICINVSLGSEIALYEEEASRRGWHLKVFSLDSLTRLLAKHPDLCNHFLGTDLPLSSTLIEDEERLFDCGHRVRQVRVDLGLGTGEFAERAGFSSEQGLKRIEAGRQECTQRALSGITAFCGASLEWLKHGKNAPYPADFLSVLYLERDLQKIRDFRPEHLYWCMEARSLAVLLAAQVTDYRWTVFDLGMRLDFWHWIEDFRYLPAFRRLLGAVYDEFQITSGRVLSCSDLMAVLNGRRHPRNIVRHNLRRGAYWAEDLRDIYHEHHTAKDYGKDHGKWILRAQECMRHFEEADLTSVPGHLQCQESE